MAKCNYLLAVPWSHVSNDGKIAKCNYLSMAPWSHGSIAAEIAKCNYLSSVVEPQASAQVPLLGSGKGANLLRETARKVLSFACIGSLDIETVRTVSPFVAPILSCFLPKKSDANCRRNERYKVSSVIGLWREKNRPFVRRKDSQSFRRKIKARIR
jgi:hypothetical protein